MRIDRLQQLADYLKDVPERSFEMGCWHVENTYCGTVACAMGHACRIPLFIQDGLTLEINDLGHGYPVYRNLTNFKAAEAFFDLSAQQACFLFLPISYPSNLKITTHDVVDRIHTLIANPGVSS